TARIAGREGGTHLAGDFARLPAVAGVVEPLLQLARDAAPVRGAEDDAVVAKQFVGVGFIHPLPQACSAAREDAVLDRISELFRQPSAAVVEEKDSSQSSASRSSTWTTSWNVSKG